LNSHASSSPARAKAKFFYGWYIVAVGFLSHVACAFHMSSTLSVFLKPLTEDLAVSRGLFSLLRSGEILIGAAMAPLVGPMVDRFGGRWLMAGGALAAGIGFVVMSQVSAFWQFLALRWTLVAIGGVFMCHAVVGGGVATVVRRGRTSDCQQPGILRCFTRRRRDIICLGWLALHWAILACRDHRAHSRADFHAPQSGGYGLETGRHRRARGCRRSHVIED
jgi:MFS family permease